MNGKETIDYVQGLKMSEVLVLRKEAGTGNPGAIFLWLAFAAVSKCQQDGTDPALLAPIFDRLELKVEVA